MKKTFVKTLIMTIVFILCLIIILGVTTYSWFYNGKNIDIDYFDVGVVNVEEIKIKINDEEFGFEAIDDKDVNLSPVAGIGEKMFEPVMGNKLVYDGDEYKAYQFLPTSYVEIKNIDECSSIYTAVATIKSLQACSLGINLSSLSIDAKNTTISSDISANGLDLNYIKSALRIAILQKTSTGFKTKFVWIPYSKYELTLKDGIYSINTNGKMESEYNFVIGTKTTDVIKFNTTSSSDFVEKNNIIFYYGLRTDNSVINFADIIEGETEFKIVMWLDGNDRECHPAFQAATDGIFNCNISLSMDIIATFGGEDE